MTTTTPNGNGSYLLRDRASVQARQDQALRLREQGRTYAEIAVTLGFAVNQWTTGRESARRAVLAGAKRRAANGGMFARQFGIEIECVGISMEAINAALAPVLGLDHIHTGGYHGRRCGTCGAEYRKGRDWVIERDGSLSHDSGLTAEVVSPILKGLDGFEALRKAMEAIKAAGGKTNISCGMHVHHDVSDMSGDERAEALRFYNDRFSAISNLVARSRRGSRWCGEYSPRDLVSAMESLSANGYYGDRYKAVNVTSVSRYNTLEFRQHQGTLNVKKAAAWIRFGQAVMEAAKRGTTHLIPTETNAMLDAMVSHAGLDRDVAEFMKTRARVDLGYVAPAAEAA